jgi:hypothetical protein
VHIECSLLSLSSFETLFTFLLAKPLLAYNFSIRRYGVSSIVCVNVKESWLDDCFSQYSFAHFWRPAMEAEDRSNVLRMLVERHTFTSRVRVRPCYAGTHHRALLLKPIDEPEMFFEQCGLEYFKVSTCSGTRRTLF